MGGCGEHVFVAGVDVHGVDFLFVNAQRGGCELTRAHVELVQVSDVVAHQRAVSVGELVARGKLILFGVDGFLKDAALWIEHSNGAVVRARQQFPT